MLNDVHDFCALDGVLQVKCKFVPVLKVLPL